MRRQCVSVLPFLLCSIAQGAQVIYQKSLPAALVALDAAGNVYVTDSATLTKLDSTGNILYSKPLSLNIGVSAIAVDPSGNVVVVGNTALDNLPTTPGVFQPKRNSAGQCLTGDMAAKPVPCPDAFVAKFDANGNVAWASYLGGKAQDQANAVAIDQSGNVYVAGFTLSADFPNVSAFQSNLGGYADGFVTRISADGSRILYSSFIGGVGYDVAHAITVDSSGDAYVAGELQGSGLPVTSSSFGPACDGSSTNAFLIKVAAAGDHLVFGGCLGGGGGFSAATAIALNAAGNAYLAGETNTKTFPVTAGAFVRSDSTTFTFVTQISPDGERLIYSSLFEGASAGVYGIAVDSSGSAYLTGQTASKTIPITGPALQPCAGPTGLTYNYLMKLNPAGAAPTYLSFEDPAAPSIGLALAADGSLYEAYGSLLRKTAALDLPGGPFLSGDCVLQGASFVSHLLYSQPGISPGEVVTLKGTGLGPAAGAVFTASNNRVGTLLAGTQVFFDGAAAPVLYAQDSQINVVAPYGLAGKTQTSIQVQYQNQTTTPVVIPVSAASAAVFTNFATAGPLVLNEDLTVNSGGNPAAQGTAVILYLTGAGQTNPPGADGQVWQTTGSLQAAVSATLVNANPDIQTIFVPPVLYAGPVPGVVAGVEQVSLQIPALPGYFFTAPTFGNGYLSVVIGPQTITVPVAVK